MATVSGAGEEFVGEVVPVLQELVRNRCVNDGSPGSGGEARNADTLAAVLDVPGIAVERFDTAPGRSSLVARLEGSSAQNPTLLVHVPLDVGPVDEREWSHDPFGGELIDGEVWGRGTQGELVRAATAAVALRHLAETGSRPGGDVVFVGAADELGGGDLGVRWLAHHHPDLVAADWVIAAGGGLPVPSPLGLVLSVVTAERAFSVFRVTVAGEVPVVGDSSTTAPVRAAEATRRITEFAPAGGVSPVLVEFLETTGWDQVAGPIGKGGPDQEAAIEALPPELATLARMETRPSLRVTGMSSDADVPRAAGPVADRLQLDVEVTALPGQDDGSTRRLLADALDEVPGVESIEMVSHRAATASDTGGPFWDALRRCSQRRFPNAQLAPVVSPFQTCSDVYRDAGATVYGFVLLGPKQARSYLEMATATSDLRVDLGTLGLTTLLWVDLASSLNR